MKKTVSLFLAAVLIACTISVIGSGAFSVKAAAADGNGLFVCKPDSLAFEMPKIIYSKTSAAQQASQIVTVGTGVTCTVIKEGMCIGTGSEFEFSSAAGTERYTLVIDGDVDGDGVCDVLDAALVEKMANNGEVQATKAQALAANSAATETVDVTSYQNVVNIALGKTSEYILDTFNGIIDSVKTDKPGFTSEKESVCRRCSITVSGFPISSVNVEDTEMLEYLEANELLLKLTSSTEEYNEMVESVKEAYKPKTVEYSIAKGSLDHYYKFPVNDSLVSSLLTEQDVLGNLSRSVGETQTVYTASFCDEVFASGDDYMNALTRHTGSYAKIFGLPQLSSTSNVKQMNLKNGTVTVTVDNASGKPVKVEYTYTYELFVSNNQYMTQKNTVDVTEVYTVNN